MADNQREVAPRVVFVIPCIPGRMSLSVEAAKGFMKHPQRDLLPEWPMKEARAVVGRGAQFWWTGGVSEEIREHAGADSEELAH